MLRLTVHPLDENVLFVAQTRDRNGHAVDATDSGDADVWGASEELGFAAQSPGVQFPILDIDRLGTFDAIIRENDIVTVPSITPFYEYTQELCDSENGSTVTPLVADPADATRTLWNYVGSEFRFLSIFFSIATAGVWTSAAIQAQYWNGDGWQDLTLVEGSLLAKLSGESDQVSWAAPTDWFPSVVQHSQSSATEGQRDVYGKRLFWVRYRLTTFVGLTSLPILNGCWEGDERSESNTAYWPLVIRPEKPTLVMHQMAHDPNAHLVDVPVVSRKQPATLSTGELDFGRGDYWAWVPTYAGAPIVGTDPTKLDKPATGLNKVGTEVTLPIPSRGTVLKPGRYRARVMAEIPNADANPLASATGHSPIPPVASPDDPEDPEAAFDPTWRPVMAAALEHFDVRARNVKARVEVQRLASGYDSYAIWLERDGEHVPLQNQTDEDLDYARLIVQDATTGALLVDTMTSASTGAGPLNPMPGVSGRDLHVFNYTETAGARQLQNQGQYILTAMIVRGGQAFVTSQHVAFAA